MHALQINGEFPKDRPNPTDSHTEIDSVATRIREGVLVSACCSCKTKETLGSVVLHFNHKQCIF